jgi:hypothetical protein
MSREGTFAIAAGLASGLRVRMAPRTGRCGRREVNTNRGENSSGRGKIRKRQSRSRERERKITWKSAGEK